MEQVITDEMIDTIPLLDDREKKECSFALLYASTYRHGTQGHVAYMLIAKLVQLLINSRKGL
jgi:hypothetical protein